MSSASSARPGTPPISVLTRALVAEIRAAFESDAHQVDGSDSATSQQPQQQPIELSLAHHAIERLENLDLLALSGLDVAGNRLRQLHGLEAQPALRELNVADNLMCVSVGRIYSALRE